MNYLTSSDRFYDDFSSSNEDEDQGEDEDIFYHNYSVEYASQMLNGKHRICPSSIDRRIRSDRHSERILKRPARSMKMSTWDQQILQNDLSNHSSRQNQQNLTSFIPRQERNLPSLDQLDQELQRRTQKLIQVRRQFVVFLFISIRKIFFVFKGSIIGKYSSTSQYHFNKRKFIDSID